MANPIGEAAASTGLGRSRLGAVGAAVVELEAGEAEASGALGRAVGEL